MNSFWRAQIADLLEHLEPKDVEDLLYEQYGNHPDIEQIISIVGQASACIKGFTKKAYDELPIWKPGLEIWIEIAGKKMLYSRPSSLEDFEQQLDELRREKGKEKKIIHFAQSYVGFGNEQGQSNFAIPNSEGEVGPGTASSQDSTQAPDGSYTGRVNMRKDRQLQKKDKEVKEKEEELEKALKKRRKQRAFVIQRLATKPGSALSGVTETVQDAADDVKKDTKEIDTGVEEVEDSVTENSSDISQTTKKTKTKVTDTSKDMTKTVKEVSDETANQADKIEDSTDKAVKSIKRLDDAMNNF